jgi:hypothetical protein
MPTGTMFIHPRIGSLFIHAEDGKYYQPRPEVLLAPETPVTFDVLNLPGAPPGFHFAGNVQAAPRVTQTLTGTLFVHPTYNSLFINGDDGKYYQPRPDVTLTSGTKVSFDVLNLPGAPPGFHFGGNVQAAPVAPSNPAPPSTLPPAPKALGAWGKPLPASLTKPDDTTGQSPVLVTNRAVVTPALPLPNAATPRTLTERQTREDFEAISRKVASLSWDASEGFGPSVTVATKLKWEGEGIELYMRVLEEYQDKRIPGTRLYCYVGTIGVNWGKGGFRISAHSHPKASIGKSKTFTVLHVEN